MKLTFDLLEERINDLRRDIMSGREVINNRFQEIQMLADSLKSHTVDFPMKVRGLETHVVPVKYKIVDLRQTSVGCPNQWEGKFSDGDYCYIRAKAGFSISKSPTKDGMGDDDYTIFECDVPEKNSFWYNMTTQELISLCKKLDAPVEFKCTETWGYIKL